MGYYILGGNSLRRLSFSHSVAAARRLCRHKQTVMIGHTNPHGCCFDVRSDFRGQSWLSCFERRMYRDALQGLDIEENIGPDTDLRGVRKSASTPQIDLARFVSEDFCF